MTRARSGCVSTPTLSPPGVKADCPARGWLLQRRMPRRACGVRPFWRRWCAPPTSPTAWIPVTRTRALPHRLLEVCVGWCPLPERPQRRHSCSQSGLGRACGISRLSRSQSILPRNRPNPRLRLRNRPPADKPDAQAKSAPVETVSSSLSAAKTRERQEAADEKAKNEEKAADAERRAKFADVGRADSALREQPARDGLVTQPPAKPQPTPQPVSSPRQTDQLQKQTQDFRQNQAPSANQTQRPRIRTPIKLKLRRRRRTRLRVRRRHGRPRHHPLARRQSARGAAATRGRRRGGSGRKPCRRG